MSPARRRLQLGIRENLLQFSLLVLVNALVGAMVGMERAILPAVAEEVFSVAASTAILSFIVVFGLTKAAANYVAGWLSDAYGRRAVLVGGWLVAVPVPFLLMWAPSWNWIVGANALLGISQGLTWSATVIMKIDLAGPSQRGLAMGLNEFAGYLAVGVSSLATAYVAARVGLHPEPFALGVLYVFFGGALSIGLVGETRGHALLEQAALSGPDQRPKRSAWEVFLSTTLHDRNLSSVTQAGFVNNLNDAVAWGVFPILYAGAGLDLERIGALAAIYPAVWGIGQLFTGPLSDHLGRKPLIVWGMWTQAAAIALVAVSSGFAGFASASVLLGLGTALVYPTLLAAIGDTAHPSWRAGAVGVYRLWRDLGYAFGALGAGAMADLVSLEAAVWSVALLTFVSGAVVRLRMRGSGLDPGGPGQDPQLSPPRAELE